MASTSGCSHELHDLQLSDPSCRMCDSSQKSDFATTTPVNEVDHATPSTSYISALEEQIQRSKAHWSTLANQSSSMDEDKVDFRLSNEQEFLSLQMDPTWGGFFANFTGDGISTELNYEDLGELVLGKKFAEGGQAELYDVLIKWFDPANVEDDRIKCSEYVLKVFKEGTLLKHVKSQLPQGLLQSYSEGMKNSRSSTPERIPQYVSGVLHGILLKTGRFAFLMIKEHFDLRTLIECNMGLRSGEYLGPFSKKDVPLLMYFVALGVEWLHNRGIVHRDLKASNVLVRDFGSPYRLRWNCYVADYECSIGVVGTNFFRAPEILQACKERKHKERLEVFSRGADVYAYGMTCYEILTGELPFEDHPLNDTPTLLIDLVINQHLRPEVLEYVEEWTCELLCRCWTFDPIARPRIGEILNVLLNNFARVRKYDNLFKKIYGENHRS